MIRLTMLACLLAIAVPGGAASAEPATVSAPIPDEAQITRIEKTFFDHLKAGDMKAAFDASIGASPLMAGRTADRAALVAQFSTGIEAYGPVRRVEQLSETRLGTMLVRRTYLAQHETMLTRWQIDFVRLPTGWTASYLTFDDQVKNWE